MLEKISEWLETLCDSAGVNNLHGAAQTAAQLLNRYVQESTTDAAGNLIATLPGERKDAPVLVLEAHMDEIGFIITGIEKNGFLRVAPCGGVDLRCLAAAPVTVWRSKGESVRGVFCAMPPHLLSEDEKPKAAPADKLFVDVGMSAADNGIQVGDRVSFAPNFCRMDKHLVTSKALDNRAGMAAVLYALSLLEGKKRPYTIKVLFSAGEELGCRGAIPAAYTANAAAAIVTDVSFAYTPDAPRADCGDMGKGAMCGIAPTLDAAFSARLQQIAQQRGIPCRPEVIGGKTGTDADVIGISRGGVRTALLSVPLRYMHTPVEMVDIRDIQAVGALMAAFVEEEVLAV